MLCHARSALLLCVVLALGCESPAKHPEVATVVAQSGTLARVVEATGVLESVKATRVGPPSDLPDPLKLVYLAEDGAEVKKGDLLVRFDEGDFVRRFQQEAFEERSSQAKLQKEQTLARGAESDRERSRNLASREKEWMERFQKKDEQIFSRHQIIESELDQELQSSKVAHAASAQKIDRRISEAKIEVLASDRQKADLQMTQAKKALQKLEVTAPHEGVFVLERNWAGETVKVGDMVRSRQTLARIQLLESLQAEVFVLEAEAEGLEAGRPATITLEAVPGRLYKAKVRRVESIAKRRFREVPTQYFRTSLELESTDPDVMKPGKRVAAQLDLGSQEGIVLPRQAVFEVDREYFVFRQLQKGQFDRVPVELGPSTAGRVLIKSGIKEGDVVALSDPSLKAPTTPKAPRNGSAVSNVVSSGTP